jgi:hypothetical protein
MRVHVEVHRWQKSLWSGVQQYNSGPGLNSCKRHAGHGTWNVAEDPQTGEEGCNRKSKIHIIKEKKVKVIS